MMKWFIGLIGLTIGMMGCEKPEVPSNMEGNVEEDAEAKPEIVKWTEEDDRKYKEEVQTLCRLQCYRDSLVSCAELLNSHQMTDRCLWAQLECRKKRCESTPETVDLDIFFQCKMKSMLDEEYDRCISFFCRMGQFQDYEFGFLNFMYKYYCIEKNR